MGQIRVRTQDDPFLSRSIPIDHLQVSGTSTGTANTLLTVRENVLLKVRQLRVANITGTDATLTLHSVADGGSISDANAEMKALTIPANSNADMTPFVGQLYTAGTTLEVYSGTTNALVMSGWAEEIL